MVHYLVSPQFNANDEYATVQTWQVKNGAPVSKGEIVCHLETTKTMVDIEADVAGYIYPLVAAGDKVKVGEALAAIAGTNDLNPAELLAAWRAMTPASTTAATSRRWTKKAALVANRLGIDIERLANDFPGETISEAHVQQAAATTGTAPAGATPVTRVTRQFSIHDPERVLLIGGAAGGGVVALDAIRRTTHQNAVGILDSNSETHGREIRGVPVLGDFAMAEALWQQGAFDGAIIVFTGDLVERARWYDTLKAAGIRFTNVIDPSVILRPTQRIGDGNLIMGHSYLAANVTIGNNNFFASHTCIEHHNVIGSHCSFGPRCTTSGAVKIGDFVKFGMHVGIEPYLSIGSRSVIASGCVITQDIAENSQVKLHQSHIIRERQS